jgi:hypothetical protein
MKTAAGSSTFHKAQLLMHTAKADYHINCQLWNPIVTGINLQPPSSGCHSNKPKTYCGVRLDMSVQADCLTQACQLYALLAALMTGGHSSMFSHCSSSDGS